MMAYETASGETLDEGQKEAATEELVTTGELADAIGQEEATDLMNNIKQDVVSVLAIIELVTKVRFAVFT